MHTDFWKLTTSTFFIAAAMYMLIPTMPEILSSVLELSQTQIASWTGMPGISVFAFGLFCSYLIQRYRRNKVCILSTACMALTILATTYLMDEFLLKGIIQESPVFLLATRGLMGAFFGLSLMILSSTLTIDCCDSDHRTKANTIMAWTHLAAIPAGGSIGLLMVIESNIQNVLYTAMASCFIAIYIMSSIKFPFKAPEETLKRMSCDRFFVVSSLPIIIPNIAIGIVIGTVIICIRQMKEFAGILAGILLAILAIYIIFFRKSQTTKCKFTLCGGNHTTTMLPAIGYALLAASLILAIRALTVNPLLHLICMVASGAAATILMSVHHSCFIETADHCQRGSALSTYFLTLELGISIGLFTSLMTAAPQNPVCEFTTDNIYYILLTSSIIAALSYFFITKKYISDKIERNM